MILTKEHRDAGYYWVKFKEDTEEEPPIDDYYEPPQWILAQYDVDEYGDGTWYVFGNDMFYEERDFSHIVSATVSDPPQD